MSTPLNVIAFAASTSQNSVNKKLVTYATSLLSHSQVEILDLNDFDMPLFSVDIEKDIGQHPNALKLVAKIASADALVISFAEHNGSYSAAYKSIFDWCSRIETSVYQNKDAIFLSASPGKRGGANVMKTALESAERFGANVKSHFSLPSFNDNFDTEAMCIRDAELDAELKKVMQALES